MLEICFSMSLNNFDLSKQKGFLIETWFHFIVTWHILRMTKFFGIYFR